MSSAATRSLIRSARAQGILPADAVPLATTRPWPIILLTALGAWLAAVPLFLLVEHLFGQHLIYGEGCYFLASFTLVVAMFAFRVEAGNDFVEQFGVPALLAGLGLLAFGLYRDVDEWFANALLTLLIIGIGCYLRQNWLRILLGALACVTFMFMTSNAQILRDVTFWSAASFALLVWLATMLCIDHCELSGSNAGILLTCESLATGWLLAMLGMLSYGAGPTLLSAAVLGFDHSHDGTARLVLDSLPRAVSCTLTLVAIGWLLHHWPALRAVRYLAAATLLAAMAWLIPALGVPLLALSCCATSSRWPHAAASGSAAASVIGSFYYQLELPLATKGIIMVGVGTAFGIIAWRCQLALPVKTETVEASATATGTAVRIRPLGVAASLLIILLGVNAGIWQKKTQISNGRQVFIELLPVDPRSLMQGDYMALNFQLAGLPDTAFGDRQRVKAIAKVDERGVAVIQGQPTDRPLRQDEFPLELTPTLTGLRPATDAWYFKEGEAERWAKARYGEFRVDPQGHAVLIDLRGPNLEKL